MDMRIVKISCLGLVAAAAVLGAALADAPR
jgi:hypothetical protein